MSAWVVGILCAITVLLSAWYRRKSRRSLPLPPGPPGEPVIGHLRTFPSSHQSAAFSKLGSQYGDIIYFNLVGQPIIVLNKYEDAVNLLEKRSAIYSSRPQNYVTIKLAGLHGLTGTLPYGDQWRMHRRLLQEMLIEKSCVGYQDMEMREARILVRMLLECKGDCVPAVQRYSAAVPLEVAYGHRVTSEHDAILVLAKKATHAAEVAMQPGMLLDYFPFLQHIPYWLPGCSSFTAVVREWRPDIRRLYDGCFNMVRSQMEAKSARQSLIYTYLDRFETQGTLTPDLSEAVKDTAAVLVIAGYDTTWSTLVTFVLAMLLFPDVQRKAQAELDAVIGLNRLPTFEDRSSLPYLDCVQCEVMRWEPVVAPSLPHTTVKDDVYNGMFIPKGAIIIPNAPAMAHDHRVHREPDRFYPERYLPEPAGWGEKHRSVEFGFGRRVCPGRHLATDATWIAVATILSTLNIKNPIDGNGKESLPKVEFHDAIVRHPKPFQCVVEPRSREVESLVTE